MIARGLKREQRRARIDAAAAAIMLQDYLDTRRKSGVGSRESAEEPDGEP
jgi:hypothetical protein